MTTTAGPLAGASLEAFLPRPVAGMLSQLSRYTLVSAVALGLDVGVFMALAHGAGFKASAAGIVGYTAGLALHFLLSSRFVFDTGASAKSKVRLFAEFVLSGLVGLAITAVVIAAATDLAGLPPVVGKGAAVVVSFASVFVLRRTIVFAARQTNQP